MPLLRHGFGYLGRVKPSLSFASSFFVLENSPPPYWNVTLCPVLFVLFVVYCTVLSMMNKKKTRPDRQHDKQSTRPPTVPISLPPKPDTKSSAP